MTTTENQNQPPADEYPRPHCPECKKPLHPIVEGMRIPPNLIARAIFCAHCGYTHGVQLITAIPDQKLIKTPGSPV